jgi:hypothetical protein
MNHNLRQIRPAEHTDIITFGLKKIRIDNVYQTYYRVEYLIFGPKPNIFALLFEFQAAIKDMLIVRARRFGSYMFRHFSQFLHSKWYRPIHLFRLYQSVKKPVCFPRSMTDVLDSIFVMLIQFWD